MAQHGINPRAVEMKPQDIAQASRHMTEGKLKAREVAKMYGVSERSLWRNLRWAADLKTLRGEKTQLTE